MKRIALLFLVFVVTFTLFACADVPSDEIQKPNSVSPSPQDDSQEKETTAPVSEPVASISETVLVDEAGIKITAKSFESNGFWGPEVKLLIENNSGIDLTFQTRNSSVNGYMAETMMSVDVVDGKKANDSLCFSTADMEACGIDAIADMEFSFHVFSTDTWEDYYNSPMIQLKTTNADTYDYSFDDSGDVVHDEDGIKIVVKGLSEDDSIFGPGVVVYIENNSNQNITIQAQDVSINGFMIESIFSSDVLVGKHAVDSITFFSSDLEENEITQIETIELTFHIFNTETWDTITYSDPIYMEY